MIDLTRRRFVQAGGAVAVAALVPINRLHAEPELVRLPAAYHQQRFPPDVRHDSDWDLDREVLDDARESFRFLDADWIEVPSYARPFVDALPLKVYEETLIGPRWGGWSEFYVRRPRCEVPGRYLQPLPDWWPS